jgi:hypothetical protein
LPEGKVLKPYASFEPWSELVRGAIVYSRLDDPLDTQEDLAKMADTSARALAGLVVGWRELCKWHNVESCTAREAHDWLAEDLEYKAKNPGHVLRFPELLEALDEHCNTHGHKLPDVRQISSMLSSFRGRAHEVEYLEVDDRSNKGQRWMVKKYE